MVATKAVKSERIELLPPARKTIPVPITGKTELIVHAWSEKSKRQMLEKQMQKTRAKKEAKDPQADYESSLYRFDNGQGGYGLPATAIKAAMISAARAFEGITMTSLKQAIFVEADGFTKDGIPLIKIIGEPRMREDMVRLETGVADIRYRAGFPVWKAEPRITFNERMISTESIFNLAIEAGYCGVGEWRPTAKKGPGPFGTFELDMARIQQIQKKEAS